MGIDDNLLNKRSSDTPSDGKSEENEAASRVSSSSNDSSADDKAAEFAQNQVEARQQKAAADNQVQKQEQKKATDAKPNPVNSCSGSCLKKAWLNLIPSWGLTLIWINIHVFLQTVLGEKMFCKLGMEWVPEELKKAQFEEAKKMGKVAGTFEGAGLACLDLGCLLIIIGVAALIYTLVDNLFVNFFLWVVNLF